MSDRSINCIVTCAVKMCLCSLLVSTGLPTCSKNQLTAVSQLLPSKKASELSAPCATAFQQALLVQAAYSHYTRSDAAVAQPALKGYYTDLAPFPLTVYCQLQRLQETVGMCS